MLTGVCINIEPWSVPQIDYWSLCSIWRSSLSQSGGPSEPSGGSNNLPWCLCGRCRVMPTPQENLCCKSRPCITTKEMSETVILNRDVLSVAIVHRSDVYSDDYQYEPSDYCKATDSVLCGGVDIWVGETERWSLLVLFGVSGKISNSWWELFGMNIKKTFEISCDWANNDYLLSHK